MVMRVWRFLTATKRQGQAHGIDEHISHRRKGNLIVHCPCCLEPHMNMEPGCERTPRNLRYGYPCIFPLSIYNRQIFSHLIQTQYTADGNHHSNKYSKNTDPDDISLYNGTAYFPEDTAYREFVRNMPNKAPEAGRPLIDRLALLLILISSLEGTLRPSERCEQAEPQKVQEYGYHRHRQHSM
jgi:hypothetical protein